jgi:hypothetical protein
MIAPQYCWNKHHNDQKLKKETDRERIGALIFLNGKAQPAQKGFDGDREWSQKLIASSIR